ncbi:MAG: hypothetical protein GX230_09150 [Lentisphaerae bacterium]|jgi:ribosomal protein S27E|nr:hypothetical protein [Lentisphaerota bacterium]
MASSREINCTACGKTALARLEPLYEDFRKVGEEAICTACGHRYASPEETPFAKASSRPRVFTDADKPREIKVFSDDERRKSCAWCAHFVINPFNQRCGLTNKEVEATDLCFNFAPRKEQQEESE